MSCPDRFHTIWYRHLKGHFVVEVLYEVVELHEGACEGGNRGKPPCVMKFLSGSLLERCLHFRGWYVQASIELGPEDVSLLERRPHFRGWYVQTPKVAT